ncbi:alpha/beta hydrolase [Parvibium lacunae]|uniref:Alpha/beta hydrolase n=2 Tax=Parvibium lacunae TaxID=1888893 RepID=A0A368L3V7_9BURK|nr:alpha/beta hydrolase [Parvibium lacunae]
MTGLLSFLLVLLSLVWGSPGTAAELSTADVAPQGWLISAADGANQALLPLYMSANGEALRLLPTLTPALSQTAGVPSSRAPLTIKHVMLLVHGTQRNAKDYFATLSRAAQAEQAAQPAQPILAETLLLAPQFLTPSDAPTPATAGHAETTLAYLRWSAEGWKSGEASIAPAGSSWSSFAAVDTLLRILAQHELLPNLQTITIAGHSAGAQFVQRYAAFTPLPEMLSKQGIQLRFVVANPSSYLYFSPAAAGPAGAAPRCPDSQDYKYGLAHLPPALVALLPSAWQGMDSIQLGPLLAARYRSRQIVTLLGERDNNPRHRVLDQHCAAQLQGPHRLARGLAYQQYLTSAWPLPADTQAARQPFYVIPNAAHDHAQIFLSTCGRRVLWGQACE